MEGIEQEIIKLSKINSAGLINIRINNLWMNINKYATSGKYYQWNSELDRIWCELAGDTLKDSKEGKDFMKINVEVAKELKDFKDAVGFATFTDKDRKQMVKIYIALQKKEIFLRRLQNKQGKGTAYVEPEDQWE